MLIIYIKRSVILLLATNKPCSSYSLHMKPDTPAPIHPKYANDRVLHPLTIITHAKVGLEFRKGAHFLLGDTCKVY